MEQKHIRSSLVYDRLPPVSDKYPWLVAQTLEEKEDDVNGDQIFYTVNNPMSHYRCRIPELLGRHIRGCFHGWVILSNGDNDKWFLWNPVTSKLIRLPRLILKDGASDDIGYYCLSSPPYDPGSIILFMRYSKPNFVFCRLDRKIKKLRWIEMSYSKQLRSITHIAGIDENEEIEDFLIQPVCCNGKVYASTKYSNDIIQLHIVVKKKEVEISLVPFVSHPKFYVRGGFSSVFLKGSCEELFIIVVDFTYTTCKLDDVCLYKLDMTSMVWAEMNELNGKVFFINLYYKNRSVICSPPIASELGGYIHILDQTSKVIYSYDVKDKSISMSSMHCLDLPPRSGNLQTSHISVWTIIPEEFRLEGDDGEAKCKFDAKQDGEGKEDWMVVRSCKNDEAEFYSKTKELQLLNIPFHVLEMIMEFCVGVEYLNFRATCKRCHLASPVIQWSSEKGQRRLQTYSLTSPWLMAFEKDRGIISFTDPMFGDKYFIKASQELFYDKRILCSRYGWLLLFIGLQLIVFFNPFTSEIRELPDVSHLDCFCFSAPPTSPDCMVVGFLTEFDGTRTIYLHSVGQELSWRIIHLDFGSLLFHLPTFSDRDVYVLSHKGGLHVLKDDDSSFETVVAEPPRRSCIASTEYFLVKCDQHPLLLVVMGDFGGSVEVFKLKDDCSRKEWEKMDGLGRHMIYICGETCICMDAKTPEMENKVYFPLLHSKNEKIVFYSLETCRYHTFKGRDVDENSMDVFETKRIVTTRAWIEPSWT